MIGLKIAIVCFVALADMYGGEVVANDPAPVVQETEAPTQAPTEAVIVPTAPKAEGFVVYSIYGITPPAEWQRALYDELCARGVGWFYPYAICQIWQESRWNNYSSNGVDVGLTQQKEIYWQGRAAYWGVAGASIFDPYAQIHVFAGMMAQYLNISGGSIEWALSWYFYGNGEYADYYVRNVLEHLDALGVVR